MKEKVHLIGIGGSGMLPLAMLAVKKGYTVSGTDRSLTPEKAKWLEKSNIKVFTVPSEDNLKGSSLVVYSTAIAEDHPERKFAKKLSEQKKIRMCHRMDFLNELVKNDSLRIGLSGTHGKTSTSSMMGFVLMELGFDPTIIVGGKPLYLEDGIRNGGGKIAVFETDESDGSFLKSNANLKVCLNVDNDHLEYYGNQESLAEAFKKFVLDSKLSVLNGDDPVLQSVSSENCIFFHENQPDSNQEFYYGAFQGASDSMDVFRCSVQKEYLGTISLKIPGRHFALNALSIITLLDRSSLMGFFDPLQFSPQKAISALNQFPGVERRIERIGIRNSVSVYDDYGHHPSEVRAVLNALRGRMKKGSQIHVVFQPHRYSRTEEHYREFAESLQLADHVYLLPLYPAGEKPREGVSSGMIGNVMEKKYRLIEEESFSEIFKSVNPGDILLFQGAGDISYSIRKYLKEN
ncbi:MAG: UDP-N-acetylmuramate--L-alanine ligase [Spirochaetia bacterium]|nr:UDP-N-acetylmuramate--L-alanine ligase [Spirochaetia bacterium]